MNRKKILFVLNYYYPYISGLSEYARIVAEALCDSYDITVLTGKHEANLPQYEVMSRVKIIRAKPLFFIHKGYISLDYIMKFIKLARSHDLINMHLPMFEAGFLSAFLPHKKPLVVTYQCDVVSTKGFIDFLATTFTKFSCRICLSKSNKIVVSSLDYASGSNVTKNLEHKLVEVYPPCKKVIFDQQIYEEQKKRDKSYRIGFLGRFVKEKGIELLLDAIPFVLQIYPDAKFILAGDYAKIAGGSIFNNISYKIEQLKDNIEILGRITDDQIHHFYNSLDLFVLPSINSYEAFGMVQVEALRAGAMVVATDRRGIRVPINKTGYGELVMPCDHKLLADGIIKCLKRVSLIDRRHIVEIVNKSFSEQETFQKYKQIFSELLY